MNAIKKNRILLTIAIVFGVAISGMLLAILFLSKGSEETPEEYTEGFKYDDSGDELFCNYLSYGDWLQTPFFSDMVEVYNAFVLLNGIESVFDVWGRYESGQFARESLKYANLDVLRSEDLKGLFRECIGLGKMLFAVDSCSYEDEPFIAFARCIEKLDSTLGVRFNVSNYVKINGDMYWDSLDNETLAKDLIDNYQCKKITGKNIESKEAVHDIELFNKKIKSEKDFNKKCAYAYTFVYHVGIHNIDLKVIEELLDDGRYSHFLFFLWRVWRCGIQLSDEEDGLSTWSQIPNKLYNEKRHAVAVATLKHIVDHPDDAVAVNQFLITASLDNILRGGGFPMGNEIFTELFYLGLEAFEEDEDE